MKTVRLQDVLEEHVASRRISGLLDLGCGDGASTRRLLYAGLRPQWVTGVDPEDTSFSPEVSLEDSGRAVTVPPAWEFIRADAHEVLTDSILPENTPEMIVAGRMLHHVRRFGSLLGNAAKLLQRSSNVHTRPPRLVVWEPVDAEGPFSELHRIKVDVDRELGMWHRPPFSRHVLERVFGRQGADAGVRWDFLCEVQASREPYSESEYRSALEDMHEYVGLVRDHRELYARLKRRLSLLPPTPASQPYGEPLLLAVATASATGI